MGPYRQGRDEARASVAPEHSVVAEMVRQFADPYAFLRELVQNGIDAGATALDVRVERTADGLVTTQVSDDGSGMTRKVIEGPLLTLFSSSKEDDPTKIGKYGVGFVSVFALAPNQVTVTTWRREGAFVVRLHPDHSWDLEAAEPRSGHGTTVSLANRMDATAFELHVERCRQALSKWCPHVRVPLHLVAVDLAAVGSPPPVRERIDTPLEVGSLASVVVESDDEVLVVGVEATPSAAVSSTPGLCAFYKRGLLLHATTTDAFAGLEGVRFKVDSPKLAHTLSRDDVRRDDAFYELVEKVRRVARRALPGVALKEIRTRAAAVAAGENPTDWLRLVQAALALPKPVDEASVVVPLTDRIGAASTLTLGEVRQRSERSGARWLPTRPGAKKTVLVASGPEPLSAALAKRSLPVVRLPFVRVPPWLLPAQRTHERYALVTPRKPQTDADRALLHEVALALTAADADVARVVFGHMPRNSPTSYLLVPKLTGPTAYALADLTRWSKSWKSSHTLVLDVAGPAGKARTRADGALRAAAQLLVRAALVGATGPIDAGSNDALLAHGPTADTAPAPRDAEPDR